jgi:hypothetical protein
MILSRTLQKHSEATGGRQGLMRVLMLKEDVERRLASLSEGEAHTTGLNLLGRLEPVTRMELPENPEPGFLHSLMLEADLWLAGTSDGWRFRAT